MWTEWMNRAGLNQADLCRVTGLHKSVISRIVNGHREPSVSVLNSLCDALSLSPSERSEALRLAGEGRRPEPAAAEV